MVKRVFFIVDNSTVYNYIFTKTSTVNCDIALFNLGSTIAPKAF